MTGNIRNRNVRFYEEKEADRRAWEILHSEAVRAFPSQNDFIIQAINDFYDRHLAISDDPYLETREKEDAFADRIVEKVEQKVLGKMKSMKYKMTVYDEFLKEYEYRKKHCGVKDNIQKKQRDRER
ncbi:hypothetical protein C809_02147 [Lachnospiraceae bacterium MD335]|nr:hypothetical protein C809_02147 [Lachnospiraceae bacterium MD335]